MSHARSLLFAPVLLALAACGPSADPATGADPVSDPAAGSAPAVPEEQVGVARLEPTEGNETRGELRFAVVDGNIHVSGRITGLTPETEHGFHVHEHGDCSASDAESAGGHFDPDDSDHGRAGRGEHHAGDSDNIRSNDEGVAEVDNWLHGATLGDGSATDIVGRGVIVHAEADDYVSQPTGDAGARLACGVVEL